MPPAAVRSALSVLAGLLLMASVPAEVALAHAEVSESAVAGRRLRDILLGRVTTWSDGAPVVIVLSEDPLSAAAVEAASGRDLQHLLRGWKRLVYAGEGAMPVVVGTSDAALTEVRRRRGALTVLAVAPTALDGLRVLEPVVVDGAMAPANGP